MACKKDHSNIQSIMAKLPVDQGGVGRHNEAGYQAGYKLDETLSIDNVLMNLEESQAGAQRHKSPHAAFALGYYNGVCQRTIDDNR